MNKIIYLTFVFTIFSFRTQPDLPDLSLKSIDGKTYNLKKDFSEKNKLYVFSFWATWCVPCIRELAEISEVYDDWKNEINFEMIAVSVDDSRTKQKVSPLVNGKGWPYTVLLDTNNDLKRRLGIIDMPYIIVVKNNKIVYSHSGYSPGDEIELFEKMKTL